MDFNQNAPRIPVVNLKFPTTLITLSGRYWKFDGKDEAKERMWRMFDIFTGKYKQKDFIPGSPQQEIPPYFIWTAKELMEYDFYSSRPLDRQQESFSTPREDDRDSYLYEE